MLLANITKGYLQDFSQQLLYYYKIRLVPTFCCYDGEIKQYVQNFTCKSLGGDEALWFSLTSTVLNSQRKLQSFLENI